MLGFFIDINLFKVTKEKAAELAKDSNSMLKNINGATESDSLSTNGLADEDANLMVKLKFLTYKVWFAPLELMRRTLFSLKFVLFLLC